MNPPLLEDCPVFRTTNKKLIEIAPSIFHGLNQTFSPKMTSIFKRVALGELELRTSSLNLSQSLPSPYFRCLLPAETKNQKFEVYLRRVSHLQPGYPDDSLALRFACAH